ncbi:DNA cytosine methyltransferase [Cereibacter sphaeroides]|uniref:DNA cytosine methyltransferase n=1 Tax=Cereibacter sphaeroides TaxID=1063 RepID=UPI0009B5F8AC|nr:DNA cytosine methyltransferase [Cereibacter sphaeroides]
MPQRFQLQPSPVERAAGIVNDASAPQIVSLFCGCGGLDLGFEQAGFNTVYAADLRSPAVSSFNHNRAPRDVARVSDVRILSAASISKCIPDAKVDGFIGGPPCQSFSRGNRSKKANDPRTDLVSKFFDVALDWHINKCPLKFIVMENVPEIGRYADGSLMQGEVRRLKENGFSVDIMILQASDFGTPQRRKRFFLVACNRIQQRTPFAAVESEVKDRTVRSAIFGLPQPLTFSERGGRAEIPYHPNHWCMTPRSRKFFDGSLLTGRSTGRSFKTLSWDKPSYTVSYGHREVHIHPDCGRRLSVHEALLLQGFPAHYELLGSMSDQFSQVSEAVPPTMARGVALGIRSCLYDI